jgi:hypothetical protein
MSKAQRLSRPETVHHTAYPNLQPVQTQLIDWELIRQQRLRLGNAETEAILHRFNRNNVQHPTYTALSELGRAAKTIIVCRYLHSEALRREINEGLNVVEHWNSANDFIFFARRGEMVSNRRDDHEIHARLTSPPELQRVMARPKWSGKLTARDPQRPDAPDLGAREPLRPFRSRHGNEIADRLTDLAARDTAFGSRPLRSGPTP